MLFHQNEQELDKSTGTDDLLSHRREKLKLKNIPLSLKCILSIRTFPSTES